MSSLAQSVGEFDIAKNFTVRVFKVSVPAGSERHSINPRKCSQMLNFANKQYR